ncbi:MAG TPA: hypothetical protein VFK48_02580 [Usitatibacter sp.]|nr:hypothetical protein [Usitatibacter sp.]
MNTFKRKALFTAVLAGLGAAGSAEAVYLNPNGMGQVLVYPYYTVQTANGNAWNTYLSVVNTTTRAKAVKVRVLEGKTSSEVLDFNLYLSANDMWTAVIFPGTGDGAAARIGTTDRSCTNPVGGLRLDAGGSGEPFRNFQFDDTAVERAIGTGLDRTREGYVEIIEMGNLLPGGAWEAAVTHDSTGTPDDCTVVQGSSLAAIALTEVVAPSGGLSGTGTLINVNNGQDAGYRADALEGWSTRANYSDAGFITPNIATADPFSVVIRSGATFESPDPNAITAYRNDFTNGARAVASVYMHSSVINEYVLDTGSLSQTDWVLTQPVKRHFVTTATAIPPYSSILRTTGACEDIQFDFFDREEQTGTTTDFSPSDTIIGSICWETTVLSVRNGAAHTNASGTVSGVLGSRNMTAVHVSDGFQNGWARLTFTGLNATTTGLASITSERLPLASSDLLATSALTPAVGVTGPVTFRGLPVTGFMVRTFQNGGLSCGTRTCQGNYGSLFNHTYETRIAP